MVKSELSEHKGAKYMRGRIWMIETEIKKVKIKNNEKRNYNTKFRKFPSNNTKACHDSKVVNYS